MNANTQYHLICSSDTYCGRTITLKRLSRIVSKSSFVHVIGQHNEGKVKKRTPCIYFRQDTYKNSILVTSDRVISVKFNGMTGKLIEEVGISMEEEEGQWILFVMPVEGYFLYSDSKFDMNLAKDGKVVYSFTYDTGKSILYRGSGIVDYKGWLYFRESKKNSLVKLKIRDALPDLERANFAGGIDKLLESVAENVDLFTLDKLSSQMYILQKTTQNTEDYMIRVYSIKTGNFLPYTHYISKLPTDKHSPEITTIQVSSHCISISRNIPTSSSYDTYTRQTHISIYTHKLKKMTTVNPQANTTICSLCLMTISPTVSLLISSPRMFVPACYMIKDYMPHAVDMQMPGMIDVMVTRIYVSRDRVYVLGFEKLKDNAMLSSHLSYYAIKL